MFQPIAGSLFLQLGDLMVQVHIFCHQLEELPVVFVDGEEK